MTVVFVFTGFVVAAAAAARSTWSPCGLSMLSSITPFGERGRRHRYAATAAWYLAGATSGGAALGGAGAAVAAVLRSAGANHHGRALAAVAAALAGLAAAGDAGVLGLRLPLIRRQVDDAWLTRYRPWAYGAGFGLQIGSGLTTYLMTFAVPLVVLLGGLSGSPVAAVGLGTAFGALRGATVFLTARASNPARLRELHRRLDACGPAVRRAAMGVQVGAAVALMLAAAGVVGGNPTGAATSVGLSVAGGLGWAVAGVRRSAPACSVPVPADRIEVRA